MFHAIIPECIVYKHVIQTFFGESCNSLICNKSC